MGFVLLIYPELSTSQLVPEVFLKMGYGRPELVLHSPFCDRRYPLDQFWFALPVPHHSPFRGLEVQ